MGVHPASPNPPFRTALLLSLLILVFGAFGSAQRSPEAEELYQEARIAVASAAERYAGLTSIIDQSLWREASRLAEAAYALAPDDPDVILLLADLYTRVGWFIRAWPHWRRYLALGGSLADESAERFAAAGTELGYSRYEAGDAVGALEYYQEVVAALPDDEEALSWLARIHYETGQPTEALPYWETLTRLAPENEGYRYYLELVQQQLAVGPEASLAFQRGLAAYEAGQLEDALTTFEEAVRFNDAFTLAHVWAGRTALELGQPAKAESHWRRVLELDPADERARYFAGLAAEQRRWGIQAANAFYEGQQLYGAGELLEAAERFDYAALLNPDYLEALAWTARIYQELGDPRRAAEYWQMLLERDPEDERARYSLELTLRQERYGGEAGLAFTEGLSAFELADLARAEASFQRAVAANPEVAEAWGWLGRVYFTQARYSEAAEAYERALELSPENDDYRFFADEAHALSGEEP